MSKYRNAINIAATHFPKATLLEQNVRNGGFVNYKVYITRKNKKINYTYKIVKGKSNQTIAIDILEEQGYNIEMLQDARDILKHPEKYKASFK